MRTERRYDVETQGGALVTSVAPPARREWQPVTPDSRLIGSRVVLAQPTTWWHDLRVVSDPYLPEVGSDWLVKITDEAYWYDANRDAAAVPDALVLAVKITEVWAE